MWFKLKIWLKNPSENLWLTPALGAIFATFFSLFATFSRYFIPSNAVPNISIETLSSLLDIIASSMLAVTTFSLSIMVAAFASASSSGTPRAYKLMMSDDNTRLAITSFISAFIYAVIAKIALGLQYYGTSGRFILFVSTILVLIYLIYTLIRWVHTLSKLGTLTTTIDKIEQAASEALIEYRTQPNYGATGQKPSKTPTFEVYSAKTGYLTHFDIIGLEELASAQDLHFHLNVSPGKFLDPQTPIILVYAQNHLTKEEQDSLQLQITNKFIIEANRSFLQDPRFGLLVMSEVGQKAMSSAINDVGSGISAINALTRILIDSQPHAEVNKLDYPHMSMHQFDIKELIFGSFAPMARDCVNNIELNVRMLKSLAMIQQNVPEPELKVAAEEMAINIVKHCLTQFEFEPDREILIETFNAQFPHSSIEQANSIHLNDID
ncbi:DUF2254 domain-containing protein [Acinetobacter shaoyimingii]|uniref:DUF2254 domain-containing protein n=1 Tax=Acinetobacter shaoyimingii TaxID=2715164 RepID=A0A6G8RRR6_9GAMM|nr:DUF2254 domain-containing protein [Acinetobacter shaoyimingii]QIO04478.1 DUF2254 domain-containing protein [Acinetobacter shaoyimingii]